MKKRYFSLSLLLALIVSCKPQPEVKLANENFPVPTIDAAIPTLTENPIITESNPPNPKEQLLHLISNNAECELPCWWGIRPGESRWFETEKLWNILGAGVSDDNEKQPALHFYSFGNMFYEGSIPTFITGELEEINGMVASLTVRLFTSPNLTRSVFWQTWDFYSPKNLFY